MYKLSDYQADLCRDASNALAKAVRALKDADRDLFTVQGMEFHQAMYMRAIEIMQDLHQEYYAASNNRDSHNNG